MNSFGRLFKIQIYGESHGPVIAIGMDGVPPGLDLTVDEFIESIQRRKPGAKGTTTRKEADFPEIMSGVFEGKTTGAPLLIQVKNENTRPRDYKQMKRIPRPGHADMTAQQKFRGFSDYRGGGHFSGRLTLALVIAGVVAKKILKSVEISSQVIEVGGNKNIEEAVSEALNQGDSVGGLIECRASGVPAGWGEPFFDSVESVISHLAFAIPAIKGIEFGSGFKAAEMKGSVHNDPILDRSGTTGSNNAGGINGGISNGNELVFRVAVKPSSSISKTQETMNLETGELADLSIRGRHDACIALRAPVVLESITAIALADLRLIHEALNRDI